MPPGARDSTDSETIPVGICSTFRIAARLSVVTANVEGILAFAERVLPSASNLWVQSSLNQKQRLQQLFFPEGIRFDGKRLVGTGLTLPVFNYLSPVSDEKKELVGPAGIEPATP